MFPTCERSQAVSTRPYVKRMTKRRWRIHLGYEQREGVEAGLITEADRNLEFWYYFSRAKFGGILMLTVEVL